VSALSTEAFERAQAGDAMIYTAVVKIDTSADESHDAAPTYQWIGLDILAADTFVCEVRLLDAQNRPVLDLDIPSAAELEFVRNVVKLSDVYQTAMVWRDTVQYTDSERLAELRLMKILGSE